MRRLHPPMGTPDMAESRRVRARRDEPLTGTRPGESSMPLPEELLSEQVQRLALFCLIASVLFRVQPNDPMSTVVAGGLLFVAALIASVPPAWRAMRVDPADGLRSE